MVEWVKLGIEILKSLRDVPTKALGLACAVSIAMLIAPKGWLMWAGIDQFVIQCRPWLGVTFLVSAVWLLVLFIDSRFKAAGRRKSAAARRGALSRHLSNLDNSEKAVLREFLLQGKRVIELPITQPEVASLIESQIICQVGRLGHLMPAGMVLHMRLTTAADELLTDAMLDIPEKISEFDRRRFANSRPHFQIEIEEYRRMMRLDP
jgi:hypothetical protein